MSETTTAELGLRERKKLETRQLIRRVALDLALEHGLENLTVEAIAHHADVSQRTFFNYFDHKDDALVTDASSAADALRQLILARPAEESPLHAIRASITRDDFFALMNTDPDRMLARQKLVRQHPALLARQLSQHAHLERAFADAVARRLGIEVGDDLRPALIAGVAGAAIRVALQWWSTHAKTDPSHLLGAAFDLVEQGLHSQSAHGPVCPSTATQEGTPSTDE